MPHHDEMSVDERRKYLKKMKPLYESADRQEKGRLLTTMEHVTGLHRKSVTRLLSETSLERHPRTTPRARSYGMEVERIVLKVWESVDYVCAERLTPTLLSSAQHLQHFGAVELTEEMEEQRATISCSTVERLLSRHRGMQRRLPQHGPHRANQVTKGVPMGRIPWEIKEPGHFEVDLVHHAGGRSMGEYLHTLQMIDVATGWSERVMVIGRGQQAMEAGFRLILARVPFPVKQLHPDNGTEFFNQHLVRFWGEKITGLQLSRSRPYHKNDNRMVEQKNDTLVRQYFGSLRLEAHQAEELNGLYEQMWTYYNFFQPVLHLTEKTYVKDKVVRKWDQAQSPWERLKATASGNIQEQDRLEQLYQKTNPLRLRKRMYTHLESLWREKQNSDDCGQRETDDRSLA